MKTIGILGAGQLARMLALAGIPMGFRFRFYDPNPDSPVKNLGELVNAPFDDIRNCVTFAQSVDVLTYEFENVPVELVRSIESVIPTRPGSLALEMSQDRLIEKNFLRRLNITTATFFEINSLEQLQKALYESGQGILKTRRLGYDGKGQHLFRNTKDENIPEIWSAMETSSCILESIVSFKRELSIVAVRALNGTTVFYPLVENVHKNGILSKTTAPAQAIAPEIQDLAETIADKVLTALDYVGTLAIEFFETDEGLIVNEMAPRVHNSGHWSIEGSRTSQFENHIRAITGLPLGKTDALGSTTMLNCIGSMPPKPDILTVEGSYYHDYDKAPRAGRKVGHINVVNNNAVQHDLAVQKLESVITRFTY